MARWIPTKRQKYGVGECSPGRGAALPRAKLGGGRRALGARVARVGVRPPLPCGVQPRLHSLGSDPGAGWGIRV